MTQPRDAGDPMVEVLQPTVKARRGTAWLNVLLGVALLAAVGGLAFAAGRVTAPAAAAFPNGGNFPGGANLGPRASGGPGGGNLPGGGGFLGAGGLTLEGTVRSKTADTLTIEMSDGQTIDVKLPSDTTYHSQAAATSDDVQNGSTVRVQVDLQGSAQGGAQGQGELSASDVTVVP